MINVGFSARMTVGDLSDRSMTVCTWPEHNHDGRRLLGASSRNSIVTGVWGVTV